MFRAGGTKARDGTGPTEWRSHTATCCSCMAHLKFLNKVPGRATFRNRARVWMTRQMPLFSVSAASAMGGIHLGRNSRMALFIFIRQYEMERFFWVWDFVILPSSPPFLITLTCRSCPVSEQICRKWAWGAGKVRTYFLLQFTPFPRKFLRNSSNWWMMFIELVSSNCHWEGVRNCYTSCQQRSVETLA